MAREFARTDRVGAQMQRELAELLRSELNDPRLGMVTIQQVRVLRDFSAATVYVTLMGNQLEIKPAIKVLNEAVPFLRHELGRRIRIRTVPNLHFVYDESVERGAHLTDLIHQAVAADRSHHPDESSED
jgi:ribosome-binding factor A